MKAADGLKMFEKRKKFFLTNAFRCGILNKLPP